MVKSHTITRFITQGALYIAFPTVYHPGDNFFKTIQLSPGVFHIVNYGMITELPALPPAATAAAAKHVQ